MKLKRIYAGTLVSAAAGIAAVGLIAGRSSSGDAHRMRPSRDNVLSRFLGGSSILVE